MQNCTNIHLEIATIAKMASLYGEPVSTNRPASKRPSRACGRDVGRHRGVCSGGMTRARRKLSGETEERRQGEKIQLTHQSP